MESRHICQGKPNGLLSGRRVPSSMCDIEACPRLTPHTHTHPCPQTPAVFKKSHSRSPVRSFHTECRWVLVTTHSAGWLCCLLSPLQKGGCHFTWPSEHITTGLDESTSRTSARAVKMRSAKMRARWSISLTVHLEKQWRNKQQLSFPPNTLYFSPSALWR